MRRVILRLFLVFAIYVQCQCKIKLVCDASILIWKKLKPIGPIMMLIMENIGMLAKPQFILSSSSY